MEAPGRGPPDHRPERGSALHLPSPSAAPGTAAAPPEPVCRPGPRQGPARPAPPPRVEPPAPRPCPMRRRRAGRRALDIPDDESRSGSWTSPLAPPRPEIEMDVDGIEDAGSRRICRPPAQASRISRRRRTRRPTGAGSGSRAVGDFEEDKPTPPSWSDPAGLPLPRPGKGAVSSAPKARSPPSRDWPVREGEKTSAAERVDAIAVRRCPRWTRRSRALPPARSRCVGRAAPHGLASPLVGLVTVGFVAEGSSSRRSAPPSTPS
jgi:hypothetical protein